MDESEMSGLEPPAHASESDAPAPSASPWRRPLAGGIAVLLVAAVTVLATRSGADALDPADQVLAAATKAIDGARSGVVSMNAVSRLSLDPSSGRANPAVLRAAVPPPGRLGQMVGSLKGEAGARLASFVALTERRYGKARAQLLADLEAGGERATRALTATIKISMRMAMASPMRGHMTGTSSAASGALPSMVMPGTVEMFVDGDQGWLRAPMLGKGYYGFPSPGGPRSMLSAASRYLSLLAESQHLDDRGVATRRGVRVRHLRARVSSPFEGVVEAWIGAADGLPREFAFVSTTETVGLSMSTKIALRLTALNQTVNVPPTPTGERLSGRDAEVLQGLGGVMGFAAAAVPETVTIGEGRSESVDAKP